MIEDMLRPFRRYADFRGRARRREYWLFILFSWVLVAAIGGVGIALGWQPIDKGEWRIIPEADATQLDWGMFAALMAMLAVLLVPTLAVQVRRFHDRECSAWWMLWHFVPYLGELVIFIAMVRGGMPGTNRYGQNPIFPIDEWGFMLDSDGRRVNA